MFVRDVNVLYSNKMLTYNMHQLLHLSLFVKRWGPLWATSAFSFENFNGFLVAFLHGTNNVGQELMNSIKIYEGFLALQYKIKRSEDTAKLRKNKFQTLGPQIEISNLSNYDKEQLRQLDFDLNNLKIYGKASVKGIMYTTQMYKQLKTNTYTVHVQLLNKKTIYGAIKFFFVLRNNVYMYLNLFSVLHKHMIYHRATMIKLKNILPIEESNEAIIINVQEIDFINPLTRVGDYICKSPNFLNKVL